MTPSKQKGTKTESALVNWLKEHGWPYARRLALKGTRDEGDVTLGDGIPVAIESKAVARLNLAGWVKELEAEVENSAADWGFVVVKKKGTQDVGEYYAVLPVKYLNEVMLNAYGKQMLAATDGPRRRVIRRTTV